MVEYREPALDATYSALAHPVRRQLVARLVGGESRVTELAALFPISLAAVSKHLRVLEEAGVVNRRVVGREHLLTLEAAPLATAAGWLDPYRRFWETRMDRLDELLRPERR